MLEHDSVHLPTGTVSASRCRGPTPALVCVHGAGVSSRELLPFVSAFDGLRRTWALDLPGFGSSSGPRSPLDLDGLTEALCQWLASTHSEPVHLLGCSYGCQILAELAVRAPENVRSVVFVGPTVDPRARTFGRQLLRWLRNSLHEPLRLGPLTFRDYLEAGPRNVVSAFSASLADPIEEKLPHISAPTLVVRGEHDAIVPQAWAEEVTRLLPRGRLLVWPGSGHMVPFAHPADFSQLVEGFIQSVSEVRE